jgi:dihydropteroate synthase
MSTKNTELKSPVYSSGTKIITFNEPLIMAIVNITPDSFYDGGKFGGADEVLRDVEEKINAGADIVDLGAASSRPGSTIISEAEEWQRLESTLRLIRQTFPKILISVDTWRAGIAEKSADAGVDILNDIGGGKLDAKMFATVARLNLPYVLMHIQGTPGTMQQNPFYHSVVSDVLAELRQSVSQLNALGFNKIILDPGFGFGKNLQHNYALLKHLQEFRDTGMPVLAGMSRKGMINQVLGTSPVTALNGTTVLNTLALLNGASILRVHDVMEALQVTQLLNLYKKTA